VFARAAAQISVAAHCNLALAEAVEELKAGDDRFVVFVMMT
jgi:hypothetical protein